MKTILFIILLSMNAYTASLTSIESVYKAGREITIMADNLEVHNKNWIGIYAATDNNDWDNVVRWTWTKEATSSQFHFTGLSQGEYEARVFYNNSFKTEASIRFSVSKQGAIETFTSKKRYNPYELIEVSAYNMLAHPKDWVAIYPKGSSNDWKNVIRWVYLGSVNNRVSFEGLEEGEYEVRTFFKDSYTVEATHSFTVKRLTTSTPSISMDYPTYSTRDYTKIFVKGFEENQQDWIAIYPKGSSNDWKNVIQWKWIDDSLKLIREGLRVYSITFKPLPEGEYEVRGFFKNSYVDETRKGFRVVKLSTTTDKLLEKAKTHCLETDNSTASILCANEGNTVYIFSEDEHNEYTYYDHYKVSLNDESVRELRSLAIADWENDVIRGEYFVSKFEESPLYITRSYDKYADEKGRYTFHANDKRVFTLGWYEQEGVIKENTLKVSDDGTKLHMERTFRYTDKKYIEVYELSDLNDIKLFSREVINSLD
ncbi:MAG: No hits [uncultured Sulfurovum sp.]|uniref:No hits n=1 Tax=uncultured Sulfurovum sp. TaxID=269237 RepID=A0A6S6SSE4_9BACT|nr:MAG: No hits [uncultured Sulfurovum sp.]